MSIHPLQLAFYKGMSGKYGAIQFNVQRPHYYVSSVDKVPDHKERARLKNFDGRFIKDEWKQAHPGLEVEDLQSREGALFLEISSTKGRNVYDWSNKTVIALSIQDLGKMLQVLEGFAPECKIMHDPGAKTAHQGKNIKTLTLQSPKGLKEGCLVRVSEKKSGEADPKLHTVPLSGDEVAVLRTCIRHAIPGALAW